MKKIFLGPPGSGKGTYSRRISPKRNIPHISTGDLLRSHIKNSTEIGLQAKEYMNKGNLVPDEMIMEILKQRIAEEDCKSGFILDGFPRTLAQAEYLKKIIDVDAVINLVIPEDILIEKICARRTCGDCGDLYNIADINRSGVVMPPLNPLKEGICDKCGGGLMQRADDNEETVQQRLETYHQQTKPLIDFYQNQGILKDVNVIGIPDQMVGIILSVLDELREEIANQD